MSALGEINKKNSKEWTPLELLIWLSSLGIGLGDDVRVEQAAAELTRLQAIEAAAREADAVLEIVGQIAETSTGKFEGLAKDLFYGLAGKIREARAALERRP